MHVHNLDLLDHLVGQSQQPIWHCNTKLLGGLAIDCEDEFSWLLHWKIGGFGPLEKATRIGAARR